VTRVSTSFAVEADTYVRPFKTVSTRPPAVSCAPLVPGIICCVCRITKVNLNVSSSSLLSLRMKFGYVAEGEGSGSWQFIQHFVPQHVICRRFNLSYHTCTNSTTLLSPRSRIADTLVAGNAFGTTFRTVRRRELVTDSEEMVTVRASLSAPSSPLSLGIY
jgi:hypothetical protein